MKTLLEKALKVSDSAEIYERMVQSTSISILLGEVQGIESEKKTEISLRIVKDGKLGAAIATDRNDDTLVSRALISLTHQKSEAEPFPNTPISEVESYSEIVKEMTTETLVASAFDLVERFKTLAKEVAFGVEVSRTFKTVSMVNSEGLDASYDYSNVEVGIYTLNEKGFYNASRSFSGADFPVITDEDLLGMFREHQLDDHEVTLENERLPVVFSGSVMGALMLRVVGGVSGANVTKGISPVTDKLGQKVFSELLTIRDDGRLPLGLNTCAFDDEGTPAQNTMVYENGVLKNYLLSVGHAKKLGMKPTGNAIKRALFSKEIEDAPTVFETNLIVEGPMTDDEALIRGIKRGLYITGVMGAHTGNINQGEFSMNISSGFLIQNGELVGKVKGAMIAGNIYELFNEIEALGTKKEPMRGIFYLMGYSPMVKFREVSIVGK